MLDRTVTHHLYAAAIGSLVLWLGGCAEPIDPALLEPADPPMELSQLPPRPEIIIFNEPADWSGPTSIPRPRVRPEIVIRAPVIEPPTVFETEDGEEVAQVVSREVLPPQVVSAAAETDPSAESAGDKPPAPTDFKTTLVAPGTLGRTEWSAGETLHGASIPTPILVAQGTRPGPTLCVTAAVHGDELNGIESVRRLMHNINPAKLTGTVIGVPIVNLQGFQRHSRYLADRRDLNRFFPGTPRGSAASRLAYNFFHDVISRCDGLVDLHTGSFHRTNLPQLRADLKNPAVLELTEGFGATVILHSQGGQGTLRRAAVEAGIPAVTLEAGEPLRLQENAVAHTVKALFTLLDTMEMYNRRSLWGNPEPTYHSSTWVRADQGGILLSKVKLGKRVKAGDILGSVTDPITNEQVNIAAPYAGRVIGMALNQFVMPGYATFHLATQAPPVEQMREPEDLHAEGLEVAIGDPIGPESSSE
ncbi:MAG: succinylglutamate desuccinylase/aspartoacylase family protein [Pseudomonadota bacterium]